MAGKKKSLGGLICNIASAALAVLAFIALAFPVYGGTLNVGGKITSSESASLSEFFDFIKNNAKLDGITGYKVGSVFLIITLVLVALCLVVAVLQIFLNNKWLRLAGLILGIATAVVALVFLICMLVGSSALSGSGYGSSLTYFAHAGTWVLALSGVGSAACVAVASRLK